MTQITIVGLGPGSPDLLTREALTVLVGAHEVIARDVGHPALGGLRAAVRVRSIDVRGDITEIGPDREAWIAHRVIELGRRPEGVVYGVPGDPIADDGATKLLLERSAAAGLTVRLVPGISYVGAAVRALRLEGLHDGLQLVEARELVALGRDGATSGNGAVDLFLGVYRAVDPSRPVLVGPIHGPDVTPLHQTLLATYPGDHPVQVVGFDAGSGDARGERTSVGNVVGLLNGRKVTYLYLPPLDRLKDVASFDTLRHIVARLRAPHGCPWDREQTYQSIKKHLIEETYEAVDALDHDDYGRFAEELGDVILQVVMYAQLGREAGDFDLEQVLAAVNAKLIRRHPHVFGDVEVGSAAEVLRNWERIKRSEKGEGAVSSFAGLPEAAPALMRADAVQSRATRYGWVPPDSERVADDKISREPGRTTLLRALGDNLFRIVATARREHVDPEEALRLATNRFVAAFDRVLADCQAERVAFDSLPEKEREERLARALGEV